MQPEQGQTYWQPDQDGEAPLGPEQLEGGEQALELPQEPVTWQASEYVQHDKHFVWYVTLAGVTVLLLALAIFTKQWSFAVVVVALGVGVGILAGRPPQLIRYTLSEHGIQVNDKHFGYHDFRSFGVIQDGPLYSVALIPTKRFMPMVHVYFPPEQGEQIVDIFGAFLPMEHVEPDFVEKLARKLRF